MVTDSVTSNAQVQGAAAYEEASSATKTSRVTSGRTIGDARLSEKGQKYYAELRKKYGDMEFILVSPDMKKAAEANAAAYAGKNKTVVLIDTEKIEKMAEDEEYRAKYEGIIQNSKSQIRKMASSFAARGTSVKGFGIKIDDGGTASFFAVIDKSQAAQKKRIEEKAAKKAKQKKADERAASKKRAERRREEQKAEKSDTVTITASSADELIKKVEDYAMMERSDYMETEEEKKMGRNFDFSA